MLETRFVPQLGRTVTRLGLGALPMGPLQRTLSVEEGARVVRAAVEGGIIFIDTATLYGTYEHIARGLKGWRGPVTLSTKTHAKADRALAEKHIETALKELGVIPSTSCCAIAPANASSRPSGDPPWRPSWPPEKKGWSAWWA